MGRFLQSATRPDEISLARPFYPRTPGGASKKQLLDALGLHSGEELLRVCERANTERGNACELFWTLGPNQVGRAAIHGWRDLLTPAVRDQSISIWPFDGDLRILLTRGGTTVVETYPAETYGHLGFPRGFGKRRREGRQQQAAAILAWCERNGAVLDASLVANVQDGFGDAACGEDAFDALIGLLGMIEAICDPAGFAVPSDPAVRSVEGWIMGTDAASVLKRAATPQRSTPYAPSMPELAHDTVLVPLEAQKGRERFCPACRQKRFARWPWGWDSHAAHKCGGIEGDTPEERKRLYRERFLR